MKEHFKLGCMVALFSILFLPRAVSEPPASSPPVTLIRCGTLIDGVSAIPRKDVLLRVEGNRIAILTEHGSALTQESTAKTIDLSTATCLPGLIDVHVHLINQDTQRRELQTPSASLSAENLLRTLRYGFTTVRNLGTDGLGPSDIDIRNSVADGSLLGPRLKICSCNTFCTCACSPSVLSVVDYVEHNIIGLMLSCRNVALLWFPIARWSQGIS